MRAVAFVGRPTVGPPATERSAASSKCGRDRAPARWRSRRRSFVTGPRRAAAVAAFAASRRVASAPPRNSPASMSGASSARPRQVDARQDDARVHAAAQEEGDLADGAARREARVERARSTFVGRACGRSTRRGATPTSRCGRTRTRSTTSLVGPEAAGDARDGVVRQGGADLGRARGPCAHAIGRRARTSTSGGAPTARTSRWATRTTTRALIEMRKCAGSSRTSNSASR